MLYPLLFSFLSVDHNNNDTQSIASFLVSSDVYEKMKKYALNTWEEDYHYYDLKDKDQQNELACDFLADYEEASRLEYEYGVHDIGFYDLPYVVNYHVDSYEVYEKFAELMNEWKKLFENLGCKVSSIKLELAGDIQEQLEKHTKEHMEELGCNIKCKTQEVKNN